MSDFWYFYLSTESTMNAVTALILEEKIDKLEFSDEFKALSMHMGYATLRQVIATDPAILQKKEGFTYSWLAELTEFLLKHNLLHMLQPTRGNNGI
jgi:hypothetical protein